MNRIKVQIGPHEYMIKSDHPQEYVKKLSTYVNDSINTIRRENANLSMTMASVLSALSICEELFEEKKKNALLEEKLSQSSQAIEVEKTKYKQMKDETIELQKKLETTGQIKHDYDQKNSNLVKRIDQLSKTLKEKDEKLKEAEELVKDANNRMYELQLKLVQQETDQDEKARS